MRGVDAFTPLFPAQPRPHRWPANRLPDRRAMKLAILSRNAKLYSTQRLIQAARERGHTVRVLDPLR